MELKKSNDKIQIFIGNTLFQVLLYILITEKWKETTFILDSQIPIETIKEMKKLDLEIEITYMNENIIFYKKAYHYYKKYFKYLCLYHNKKIDVYGNDNLQIASFFRWKKMKVLEDGIVNYRETFFHSKISFKTILKNFFKLSPILYESYGKNNKIEKVYLTGIAKIPEKIKKKVQVINLKKLWDKKELEEQKEIIKIFNLDILKDRIRLKNKIIFLTQPLSEDKIISLEEELNLYKKLFSNYNKKDLIIKPHPREKKNYRVLFPEIEILDYKFPFEMLKLMEIKVKKIATIMSSTAFDLGEGIDVDFYGTSIHPKLLEKFGDITIEKYK